MSITKHDNTSFQGDNMQQDRLEPYKENGKFKIDDRVRIGAVDELSPSAVENLASVYQLLALTLNGFDEVVYPANSGFYFKGIQEITRRVKIFQAQNDNGIYGTGIYGTGKDIFFIKKKYDPELPQNEFLDFIPCNFELVAYEIARKTALAELGKLLTMANGLQKKEGFNSVNVLVNVLMTTRQWRDEAKSALKAFTAKIEGLVKAHQDHFNEIQDELKRDIVESESEIVDFSYLLTDEQSAKKRFETAEYLYKSENNPNFLPF